MKLYKEYLKCDFSDAEKADAGRDLAMANKKRFQIEQRKKEIDADLKAKIEEQNTAIGRLSELIATGYEYRDVECRVDLDNPEAGRKRIVRLDTGEEVRIVAMTDEDRQMVLDLQAKADAEEAAKQSPPAPPSAQIAAPDGKVHGEGFIAAPAVETPPLVASEVLPDGPALSSATEAVGGTHQRRKRGAQ